MRPFAIILTALAMAGCTGMSFRNDTSGITPAASAFGPVKTFSGFRPRPIRRANAEIARDFLDLHFRLENGRSLPYFTRFEGPITLRVTGRAPATLEHDLAYLLSRLHAEAGLTIERVAADYPASITVALVSLAQIDRASPGAACFLAPNVTDLREFSAPGNRRRTDWTALSERRFVGIFLPFDTSPQELRDCLHEELAQALGPLNDIYRLPDSVFNDDNVHAVLTDFDMLILRTAYAPELRSGMTRDLVAARLPGLLRRLNPAGERVPPRFLEMTHPAWIHRIEAATRPGMRRGQRLAAAQAAAHIARAQGWEDHRRAFSGYILGLLLQEHDSELAIEHYHTGLAALPDMSGAEMYRALIGARIAAIAVAAGQGKRALARIERHIGSARHGENAALLATLMLLRAEALAIEGHDAEARSAKLDSLGWARYGLGSDSNVRKRIGEIAALNPARVGGSGGNLSLSQKDTQ